MSTGHGFALRQNAVRQLQTGGGLTLASRLQQGVSKAQVMLLQFAGAPLNDEKLKAIRRGVGPGEWSGMFVGTALNLTTKAKVGLASPYRAIRLFTAAGAERHLFILLGTDTSGPAWKGAGAIAPQRYGPTTLPIQPGDVGIIAADPGRIVLVESYHPGSATLTTLEGNVEGGTVARRGVFLMDPASASQFAGFGRLSLPDFTP